VEVSRDQLSGIRFQIKSVKNRHRFLNMKKQKFLTLGIVFFLIASHALAQNGAELQLRLRRDFGYSAGGDIQGTFTMRVSGPETVSRVVFYIDDQEIGQTAQAPFELRFSTSSYAIGAHTLSARGFTQDGRELSSNAIRTNFVSAEEGWQAGLRIMVPMLALVLGALLLSALVPLLTSKKLQNLPAGTPRNYGVAGGAICPRCGRPYPRHVFAPNMVFGKLERCPFCGKWAIVAGQPLSRLRQAEQAELENAQGETVAQESEEERLRKELDASRYREL
jgi:hypothetical protein